MLKELVQALRIYESHDPNGTLGEMVLFIEAAQHEGCTQSELVKLTGAKPTTVSRFFSEAGIEKDNRIKPKWFELIEKKGDRRFKEIWLTEEGRRLINLLRGV